METRRTTILRLTAVTGLLLLVIEFCSCGQSSHEGPADTTAEYEDNDHPADARVDTDISDGRDDVDDTGDTEDASGDPSADTDLNGAVDAVDEAHDGPNVNIEDVSDTSDPGMTDDADDATPSDADADRPSCELEGLLDPACSALDPLAPICAGGVCVGCGEVPGPACAGATPVCEPSGACVACTTQSNCPDSACHLGADDPLLGHCFQSDEVTWIDNTAPCPGLGTPESPACSLGDSTAGIVPGDARVLRIRAGMDYAEPVALSGEVTVAIIGSEYPSLVGSADEVAPTLQFGDGVTAYVDGVAIVGNPTTHGISCSFSDVRLEDSRIRNNDGWGVFNFDPCALDVRRTVIASNEDGGLRVAGGELFLVNTTVAINGVGGDSTGVRILDTEVTILYSTIAGNDGAGSDSIECSGATGSLRNSIVTGRDAVSIELDCFPLDFAHNAIDSPVFASGTNVQIEPYNAIFFNNPAGGDFRLSAPPLTPFGAVALWLTGDPEVDADGTPRPADGSLGYAGIDEP